MKALIISIGVLIIIFYAALIVFLANNYILDKQNQEYIDSLNNAKHEKIQKE